MQHFVCSEVHFDSYEQLNMSFCFLRQSSKSASFQSAQSDFDKNGVKSSTTSSSGATASRRYVEKGVPPRAQPAYLEQGARPKEAPFTLAKRGRSSEGRREIESKRRKRGRSEAASTASDGLSFVSAVTRCSQIPKRLDIYMDHISAVYTVLSFSVLSFSHTDNTLIIYA